MVEGWERAKRDLDVAFALVNTARAAQVLLADARECDDNPLSWRVSAADLDDLRVTLNRWLELTGQEGV